MRYRLPALLIAMLVALPLLPVCGFVLGGSPEIVFFLGAAAFLVGVMVVISLLGALSRPPAGSPPAARRFHFTIRDLLCLTAVLLGMTLFMASAFQCEAAERASRPNPLPVVAFRHYVWQMESGLVCLTAGCLIWIRSVFKPTKLSPALSGR